MDQSTGHYEFINAKRDAALAGRLSDRARAAILGKPYALPPAKEHRITVDCRTGERSVETIEPPTTQAANPFVRAPVVQRPIPETASLAVRIAEAQQRRLLKKIGLEPDRSVTIPQILDAVAMAYEVTIYVLTTPDRRNRSAFPRFAAMRLMRELRCMSLPRIARSTGKLDHTSVLHGLKRAAAFHENDLNWRTRYDHALTLLGKQP